MTKVYTMIKGKLAAFDIGTLDTDEAIKAVRDELGAKHKKVILAVVSKDSDLQRKLFDETT